MRSRLPIVLVGALITGSGCSGDTVEEIPPQVAAEVPTAVDADGLCAHGVLGPICPKCHPAVTAVFQAKGDWCVEHEFPESVCPICHPERGGRPAQDVSPDDAPADGTKVKFRSPSAPDLAGIETVAAGTGERAPKIQALVRIQYDATKQAIVSAPTSGVIRRVKVDVGAAVKRGTVLALVASAGVGEGRSELLRAEAMLKAAESNLARERGLHKQGVSPKRDVELAESNRDAAAASVKGARAALGVVGATERGAGGYAIAAPLAGVVTRRLVTIGQSVAAGATAFEVVDPSSMWGDVEVPEQDLGKVRAGQRIVIKIDGLPQRTFEGNVAFIAPAIDARTRTALARVRLDNGDGFLRANMFGKAYITVGVSKSSVMVPIDAVQHAEGQAFVFVRVAADAFEARRIEVGSVDAEVAEIRKGLKEGELVATTGAFLLKTEILKGAIGAGCCE